MDKCLDFIFSRMVFKSSASKAGPCMLPSCILCLLSWTGGKARGERREGRGWEGSGGNRRGEVICSVFSTPQEPLFRLIKFLPLLSPAGLPCSGTGNPACLHSSLSSLCSCYSNHQGSVYRRRGSSLLGSELSSSCAEHS